MNIKQALHMAHALILAAKDAAERNEDTVTLLPFLQDADDAARDDLAAAIEAASQRVGGTG